MSNAFEKAEKALKESEQNEPAGAPAGAKFIRGRHHARVGAVQALYHWALNPLPVASLARNIHLGKDKPSNKMDESYFYTLVEGCIERVEALDDAYRPFVQMDLDLLDPIERSVLRLSTFELLHRLDVPKRVVINEGVEMAKLYGAADGHKFINGVLDKVANAHRTHET